MAGNTGDPIWQVTSDHKPGIPAIFANAESCDCRHPNPRILGLKNSGVIRYLTIRSQNNISKHLVTYWYFVRTRVLAVQDAI